MADTGTLWLVCSTLDRVVWVQALAGDIDCAVFLGEARNSHNGSLYPGVQMGTWGNPSMN